jgi:hypothetical protein
MTVLRTASARAQLASSGTLRARGKTFAPLLRRTSGATLIAIGICACAGGSAAPISASSAQTLRSQLQQIRSVATAPDDGPATNAIATFLDTVSRLRRQHQLSGADAAVLTQDAAHLRTSVQRATGTPARNAPVTTAVTSQSSAPVVTVTSTTVTGVAPATPAQATRTPPPPHPSQQPKHKPKPKPKPRHGQGHAKGHSQDAGGE